MRLMSKGEYLIVPKGTKFTGSGKLGLNIIFMSTIASFRIDFRKSKLTSN